MSDDIPAVPEDFREFRDDLLDEDTAVLEFDDARVPVPVRFDRSASTAEWRFDGRLTVTVRERDAE